MEKERNCRKYNSYYKWWFIIFISILIAMIIENYLESHFDMFKHPLIDATGMIIGTIIILLTYKIFVMENKPIIHAFRKKVNTKKLKCREREIDK